MPKEWYISFHGGDEKTSLNNIHVYSTDGIKLRKALNKKSVPEGITLRELRGFAFGPDKNLYVVNAYFEYSEVLKFNSALNKDGQHDFAGVFVKRHADLNPGIDHPFNVAFDSNGDLYVSSQNTSLVARYHGPAGKHGQPGLPMPFPQSLDADLNLPPGTFVPSAKHERDPRRLTRSLTIAHACFVRRLAGAKKSSPDPPLVHDVLRDNRFSCLALPQQNRMQT